MDLKRKLLSQLLTGISLFLLFAGGLVMFFCASSDSNIFLMIIGLICAGFGGVSFPLVLYVCLSNWWKIKLLMLVRSGISTYTALSAGVKKNKNKVVRGIAFLINNGYLYGYKLLNDSVVLVAPKK